MKILQVCPYDFGRPGGVQQHVLSVSKYLEKAGHNVVVVGPNTGYSPKNIRFKAWGQNRGLSFGGTYIDINRMTRNEQQAFKEWCSEEAFDIIHYHTFWNPLLGFQIRKLSKAKHVATFHDTPKYRWAGKMIMPLAAGAIAPLFDAILSVSATQRQYIDPLIPKHKIQIIPNGIDLDPFQNSKDAKSKNTENTILFLGRLEPRKGVMDALLVAQNLKDRLPFKMIVAGDGPQMQFAKAFAETHQLSNVTFLGKVTDEEKYDLMNQADLLIVPSRYGESFGIILLESMAAGLPMAGYGNSGYLNVLDETQRKWFVQPGNTAALTKAVKDLIENEPIRTELGAVGREAVQQYDWKILVDKLLQVYHSVLK